MGTISTVADDISSNISKIRQSDNNYMARTNEVSNQANSTNIDNQFNFSQSNSESNNPIPASNNSNHVESDDFSDKVKFPQFECKTRNIQMLHQLISSIQPFGNYCFLDVSNDGICFSINDANICKVRLNLNKKIFADFKFNGLWKTGLNYKDSDLYGDDTFISDDEEIGKETNDGFDVDGVVTIHLNLTSFLETLNIYVKDKLDCTFRYERDGDPFTIIFENDEIVERCELNTYFIENETEKRKRRNSKKKGNSEEDIETLEGVENFDFDVVDQKDDSFFRLDSNEILYDIIIKSSILHDIIKDMNDLHTERFILYCKKLYSEEYNSKNSKLMFISQSKSVSIEFSKLIVPFKKLNIPEFKLYKPIPQNESNSDYDFIECYNMSLSSTYHFDYFAKLLKAIRLSRLIKIRKDMKGITSLLLLLGKNSTDPNNKNEGNGLYGSSIEFVVLESLSIEELSAMSIEMVSNNDILSKIGYNNKFVEQIIKDDHDIQTIRIGDNGKLITLDDYFADPGKEFEEIENNNRIPNIPPPEEVNELYPSITDSIHNRVRASSTQKPDEVNDENVLKITEQLTMSLLGHGPPVPVGASNHIQVEQTMIENDESFEEDWENTVNNKRTRASSNKKGNSKKSRSKNNKTKKSKNKKENNGIETVGGAIEIPLFI